MRSTPRRRRRSWVFSSLIVPVRASKAELVIVAVFALGAAPGIAVLLLDQLPGTPLIGLALLVPGAVAVAGERLSRDTGGPDIHDRQLDRIVAGLAASSAVALIAVAAPAGGPTLGSGLVLATALFAIGILALLYGTRRLWQQRAVPALLFLAWPVPWFAVMRPVKLWIDRGSLTVAMIGLIGAILVVLIIRPQRATTLRGGGRRARGEHTASQGWDGQGVPAQGAGAVLAIRPTRPVDTAAAVPKSTLPADSTASPNSASALDTASIDPDRRTAHRPLVVLRSRGSVDTTRPHEAPQILAVDEPTTLVLPASTGAGA